MDSQSDVSASEGPLLMDFFLSSHYSSSLGPEIHFIAPSSVPQSLLEIDFFSNWQSPHVGSLTNRLIMQV